MTNAYQQTDTILHVENVSVVYGAKTIIENISFTEKNTVRPNAQQGQTIAFLGRSGRGKSTLFRVITGLEKPTSGRILIPDYNKPINETGQPAKPVAEGDVGFVNQRYTLFRHKTVYQALMFALRKSTDSEAEKQNKVLQYLADWGLEKVKNQYPNELSGGQRQRTAILEQLLSSGYYMVLDEPFSGLDVGNIESVKKAFHLITSSHELNTIVFSTHDIELAVELADSIYVMGYASSPNDDLKQVGTIVGHFDLKAMNLSWAGTFDARHAECAKAIKAAMLAS
ncbi:MAG: ABC transporter ATP-binding protein [Bacteroidetes bacterium]|nr:MAG: ABC transporter ATP-binding protein [Bacteroidota bacterium]